MTFVPLLAILRAMRDGIRTVDALRSAVSARRDLFLEHLALRHQVGILARSNRRFRAADRLLWLCLRSLWPKWRQALVLVQPATVVRWRRGGLRRCWSRRSDRPPGRPRIDSEVRALIRRMAAENRLWGAPRIHGELLKLGIGVSDARCRVILPRSSWRSLDRSRQPPSASACFRNASRMDSGSNCSADCPWSGTNASM